MGFGKHQIIIEIDPKTGEVKSTVKGLKGSACTKASAWINELGEVTSDQHTPEFYQEPKRSVTVARNDNS